MAHPPCDELTELLRDLYAHEVALARWAGRALGVDAPPLHGGVKGLAGRVAEAIVASGRLDARLFDELAAANPMRERLIQRVRTRLLGPPTLVPFAGESGEISLDSAEISLGDADPVPALVSIDLDDLTTEEAPPLSALAG